MLSALGPSLPEADDLAQPGRNPGSGQGGFGGSTYQTPFQVFGFGLGDGVAPGLHRLATNLAPSTALSLGSLRWVGLKTGPGDRPSTEGSGLVR